VSNYSDYPDYPPPPVDGYGSAPPAPTEPPQSIKTAVSIMYAQVALSVLATILTFAFLNDIVDQSGAGLTSAEKDTARTAAIVGAVVGLLIFGGLWILLSVFLRKGRNWARITATVLAALGLLFGLINLVAGNSPALLLILGVVEVALYLALLIYMWRSDASQYVAAQRAAR
jgi:hypothetical protein